VDEDGCTVVQAGIAAGALVLHGVNFRLNSAEILDDSKPVLDEVAAAIADRPGVTVEVQGYTDSSGSEAYNLQLSQRRAEAVRDYLLSVQPGLEGRLNAKGYGESDPVADNGTAEGRAQNRRVQFVVQE
jgi:OOP family OmpA-OmpF porin